MSLNFPAGQPGAEYYDPGTGITWYWNQIAGVWGTDFVPNAAADQTYLKLDATNDPLTGDLTAEGSFGYIASVDPDNLGNPGSTGTYQRHNGRFVSYQDYDAAYFGPSYELFRTTGGAVEREFALGLSGGKPYLFTDGTNPETDASTIEFNVSPLTQFDQGIRTDIVYEIEPGDGIDFYMDGSAAASNPNSGGMSFHFDHGGDGGRNDCVMFKRGQAGSERIGNLTRFASEGIGSNIGIYCQFTGNHYAGGDVRNITYFTSDIKIDSNFKILDNSVIKDYSANSSVNLSTITRGNNITHYGFYASIENPNSTDSKAYAFYSNTNAESHHQGGLTFGQFRHESTFGGFLTNPYTTNGGPKTIFTSTSVYSTPTEYRRYIWRADNAKTVAVVFSGDTSSSDKTPKQLGNIVCDNSDVFYNTVSDYRLKSNISPLTSGIDTVKLLSPKQYNFTETPEQTVTGFLAHEVQDVVPYAVSGDKDAVDENGNPEYQGIDLSKLVPVLTKALQEAIEEIDSLKARVNTLEGN